MPKWVCDECRDGRAPKRKMCVKCPREPPERNLKPPEAFDPKILRLRKEEWICEDCRFPECSKCHLRRMDTVKRKEKIYECGLCHECETCHKSFREDYLVVEENRNQQSFFRNEQYRAYFFFICSDSRLFDTTTETQKKTQPTKSANTLEILF